MQTPKLGNWKWQDLFAVQESYHQQLNEYVDIAKRHGIELPITDPRDLYEPGMVISWPEAQKHDFMDRWLVGVRRIGRQVDVVNGEIFRRNNLIGVMG